MHVAVLGAGVIGVTTAYYLAELGHRVTVVDREQELASGASGRNGGQLSYSFTEAMASPALISKLPGIIAGHNPAFHVSFSPDPQFACWGMSFLGECTNHKNRHNSIEILQLALRSGVLMSELHKRTSLEFSYRQAGKLVLLDSNAAVTDAKTRCALKQPYGCDAQVIPIEQAVEIEPAIRHMSTDYTGAVYSKTDEVGNSRTFTTGLGEWLEANREVEFQLNTRIRKIAASAGKLTAVETDNGTLEPDAVVVCLGTWSRQLLDPLGIKSNIFPMRGYSVTLPCVDSSNSVSITDLVSKTVFSRLDDKVRIAGFADFVGYSTSKDSERVQRLLQIAQKTAPAIADFSAGEKFEWGGFRPMTPNSRPLIGATPIDGVHLNTGHGMLGWTLACASGQEVAAGV